MTCVPAYGETLKEAVTKQGIGKLSPAVPDEGRDITSYSSFWDGDDWLIAYYHRTDPLALPAELRLLLVRKSNGRWCQNVVRPGDVPGFPEGGIGSVTEVQASPGYFFVTGHKSPSSAPTLVLSRSLEPVRVLPGWIVAKFEDESLVFEHNEPHGSGIYELDLHDSSTGHSRRIYPPQTASPVREAYLKRRSEAFEKAIAEGKAAERVFPNTRGEWGSILSTDEVGRSLAVRVVFDETVGWKKTLWQRFQAFRLLRTYLYDEKMTEPYRDKFDVLVSNIKRDYLIEEAIAGIEDEELREKLSRLLARAPGIRHGTREEVEAIDPAWGSDQIWERLKSALLFPADSTEVIYIYPKLTTAGPLQCYEITRADFEERFGPSSLEHSLDPSILSSLEAEFR